MKSGTDKTDIDMPTGQKQMKRKYVRHPLSERKRAVELCEMGFGYKRIAREMGLDASTVRQWVRRYRAHGLEALLPYCHLGQDIRFTPRLVKKERKYSPAYEAYSTTLETVASITRRYGLDYNGFLYHIRNYHSELEERRNNLVRNVSPQGNVSDVRNNKNEREEE